MGAPSTTRILKSKSRDWVEQANCIDSDPSIFFDGNRPWDRDSKAAARSAAKVICNECPVKADCLNYALANNITEGTWGGMDQDERHTHRRKLLDWARRQRQAASQ